MSSTTNFPDTTCCNDERPVKTDARVEVLPRVTIGLPVYNGERYLAAAIDSILAQEFTDFELLIADNGSTDSTSDIVQAAAQRDSRIVVHRSEVNRGAAWNFNRLVDLARGTYFKWAAHDDVMKPALVQRCVEVLDARPDVVLCYPRALDINDADEVLSEWHLPAYAIQDTPSQRLWHVLLKPSECFEVFGLMRREDLLKTHCIGPYASSDRTLIAELALLGCFHEIPEVLFLHREHNTRSMTTHADAHARNVWFDPARAGKITAPKWRLMRGYTVAILAADIPTLERWRCLKTLGWWIRNHRRGLRNDLEAIFRGQALALPVQELIQEIRINE